MTAPTASNPLSVDNGRATSLGIFFNGVEFPFTRGSSLGFLNMSENVKLKLPTIHLQLNDGIEFFNQNKLALLSGSPVTVVLTVTDFTICSTFLINTTQIKKQAGTDLVTLDGYLALPKFWIETCDERFVDKTSSDVLTEIAKRVEDLDMFTPQTSHYISSTNDRQMWQGGRRRYAEFAKDLASAGYKDEFSTMVFSVDLQGSFQYVDIQVMGKPSAVFALYSVDPTKGIPVPSFSPKNNGGFSSVTNGYGQTAIEQNVINTAANKNATPWVEHKEIKVKTDEQGPINLNAKVKATVKTGPNIVMPINYGNTGNNHYKARYQNERSRSLFNNGIDCLVPIPTKQFGLDLLDTVAVSAPEELGEYQGLYRMSGRTIRVTPTDYFERIEMLRRTGT
jgi:hypothetical protein